MKPSFGVETGSSFPEEGHPGIPGSEYAPERPGSEEPDDIDPSDATESSGMERNLGDPADHGDHEGIPGSGYYPY